MDCYALIDQPRSGAENMTIDEMMLEKSVHGDCALLRLYRWSAPTLSLGYFQSYSDRELHSPSSELELVRRSTGGGAIVHHHDWTYSLTLPAIRLPNALGAAQSLYDCIHDEVVLWLNEMGVAAAKWSPQQSVPSPSCPSGSCSFLCFERRSAGDVVCGDHKLMGSAQRRHRGGLLQHGSLLLKQSSFAPSLKGLGDLGVAEFAADHAAQQHLFVRLARRFSSVIDARLIELSSLSQLVDAKIVIGKYGSAEWNEKR